MIQGYLEAEYLKPDCKALIARTRVFVDDTQQCDVYYNENDENGFDTMDAYTIVVKTDPLSEVSPLDTELERKDVQSIPEDTQQMEPQESDHYICEDCGLELASKIQLTKHRRVHQKKECLVCNLMFRSDKINDHFAKKHPKIHRKLLQECSEFRCVNCQELFETEALLNDHLDIDVKKPPLSEDTHEARVYYCAKRYKCCNCEEKFFDKLKLAKHQRVHHRIECPMCNKTLRNDKIKQHIASKHPTHDGSNTELFKCVECKKLFQNAAQLTAHRKSTHNKLVCPVCKEPTNYAHIRKHLKLFNNQDVSDDSKELSESSAGVSVVPKKENDCYQCDECGLTYPTAYQLEKHQRAHRKRKRTV